MSARAACPALPQNQGLREEYFLRQALRFDPFSQRQLFFMQAARLLRDTERQLLRTHAARLLRGR